MSASSWILSTDLDGTLIGHHDYRFAPVLPVLTRCNELGIPVVFNTSKNAAETKALREQMGVDDPYIVENGSALLHADEVLRVFGVERQLILDFIEQFRAQNGFVLTGFSDISIEELIELTNLSEEAAKLALQKQYSEPFVWQGNEAQLLRFTKAAKAELNLNVTKGGRFYHLQGNTDKSQPLKWLQRNSHTIFTGVESPNLICLGDNHNDVMMLQAADIAVQVKPAEGSYVDLSSHPPPRQIKTSLPAPEGWAEAVTSWLDEIESNMGR